MPETARHELVPTVEGSALSLARLELASRSATELGEVDDDLLLYGIAGVGALVLGDTRHPLGERTAALVQAGERARVEANRDGLELLEARIGPAAERHAPLGTREATVSLADAETEEATGARSFQVLYGPHNGSTRATLFAGFVPLGRAPWHYHLYDEIVWVPEGGARVHRRPGVEEPMPGGAFRLRPREVHIVENTRVDRELEVLGIFTPAGSPSAAYLEPDVAAEYRLSPR